MDTDATLGAVFSMVTLLELMSEAPKPSEMDTLHVMLSDGWASVGLSVNSALFPISVTPLYQVYSGTKVSPSASLYEALHVKIVDVVMALPGEIETLSIEGAVFSTTTVSLLFAVSPASSVAMTVQVISSVGCAIEEESVIEDRFPITELPLLHV